MLKYRGNCIFYVVRAKKTHGTTEYLPPCNEAVHTHP
jgi:hypothetical protein